MRFHFKMCAGVLQSSQSTSLLPVSAAVHVMQKSRNPVPTSVICTHFWMFAGCRNHCCFIHSESISLGSCVCVPQDSHDVLLCDHCWCDSVGPVAVFFLARNVVPSPRPDFVPTSFYIDQCLGSHLYV